MDQERERVQADLRGLLDGEVHCDDVFLQIYASDASIYEIKPLGVVRPKNAADVVACVEYAAETIFRFMLAERVQVWRASLSVPV